MECKKNPRIDLQKKRPLFVQIGLITALSVALFAFELKQFDKPKPIITGNSRKTVFDETIIATKHEKLPEPVQQSLITTILDIRPDVPDDIPEIIISTDWKPGGFTPLYIPEYYTRDTEEPEPPPMIFPEKYAEFQGGEEAMFEWLSNNLQYPEEARIAGIQGIVYVRFVVEKNGNIGHAEVAQGNLGGGCEEAAMDAVKRMPAWNPGKQRNRPVASWFVLPVQFQLFK
jgi:protein TonB